MNVIAFAVKKALSALLCPVGMCLALLFAALFFWRRTPKGRLSAWLGTSRGHLAVDRGTPDNRFLPHTPARRHGGLLCSS